MKFLILLLFSAQVFAQQAVIFSGQDVKALKASFDLFGQSKIRSGSVNPTSVAVNAPFGSLYLNSTSGRVYKKNDNGNTTNWYEVVDTSTAQTLVNKSIDATLNTITNIQDSMIDSEASTAGQVLTSDGAGGASWQNSSATVSTTTVEYYFKDYMEVRVISQTNLALATAYENGDTVNGVVLATNDIIGLVAQTVDSDNGIYVVQASGAPVRHVDYDTFDELNRATMYATEGTSIPEYAFHQVDTLTSLADPQTWASTPAIETFTVPVGVTKLSILACGGGGAGGNGGRVANPNTGSAGGGAGGNGGPPTLVEVKVNPGDVFDITLGRGGRRVLPVSSGVAIDGGDGSDTNFSTTGPPIVDLFFPGGAGGNGANGSNEGLTSNDLAASPVFGGLFAVNGGTGGSGSPTASSGVDGYRSIYSGGGAGGVVSATGGGGGGGGSLDRGGAGAAGVTGLNNGLDGFPGKNRCAGGGGGSGARVPTAGSTRIGGGGGQGGVGYLRITY